MCASAMAPEGSKQRPIEAFVRVVEWLFEAKYDAGSILWNRCHLYVAVT